MMDREIYELQQIDTPEQESIKNVDSQNSTDALKDNTNEMNILDNLNHTQETNMSSKPETELNGTNKISEVLVGEVPDEDQNKEIEIDVNIHDESVMGDVMGDDPSLYDDVMGTGIRENRGADSSESSSNSMRHGSSTCQPSLATNPVSTSNTNKRVCCYVGNLTWWTNDKDLSDAINSLHISDLQDIKFYENKVNGQSKGFALVTVGSDASFRTLMDKLPRVKIHGMDPIVTNFNRHYFSQFEEQARKEFPSTAGTPLNNANNEHHSQSSYSSNQQHQFYMNTRNRNFNQPISNSTQSTGLPLSRPIVSNGVSLNSLIMGQRSLGQSNNFGSMGSNGCGPSLVGTFPGIQQRIGNPQQHQQSLLGNTPPGMLPIRPTLPQNSGFIGGPNLIGRTGNGVMIQQTHTTHQQSSLLGNRPGMIGNVGSGVVQQNSTIPGSQGNGLLPMRPGMAPIGSTNNVSQAPGLLNNPPNIQSRIGNVPGQQTSQNSWDRTNQAQPNGGPGLLNPSVMMPSININQRASTSNQITHTSALTQQISGSHYIPSNQYTATPAQQTSNVASLNNLMNIGSNQPTHANLQLYQQHTQLISTPSGYGNTTHGSGYSSQNAINQHQPMHLQPPNHHTQHHHHHSHQSLMSDSAYSSSVGNQNYLRQASGGSSSINTVSSNVSSKMSEMEFQDALEKNRIISSQAISRAVQDASIGQYASAIETLVTAISLIKQSKIGYDERCKIFAASLEDTKQGIEDKYYGSLNMLQISQQQQQHRLYSSGATSRDVDSQEKSRSRYERSRSRSRSRESRDRDRDRMSDRDPSAKEHRSHHRREKHHHRSSHRDRDRERDRSRSRDRSRDRRIVSVDRDDSYYDDSANKYHRSSRH